MEAVSAPAEGWAARLTCRTVTWFVLAAGLLLLAGLLWQTGPASIASTVKSAGWRSLLVAVPYLLVAVWDTVGWQLAFPVPGCPLRYRDLFRYRLAAKAIHDLAPTWSLAGELTKVYILRLHEVAWAPAVASVVVAKATITLAELVFLLMGLMVIPLEVPAAHALYPTVWAGLFIGGIGIVGVLVWLRKGLFCPILGIGRRADFLPLRIDRHEEVLRTIDCLVRDSICGRNPRFWLSTVAHLLGWLSGAVEIWFVMVLLGVPANPADAVAIEALLLIVQGLTGFMPANVGTLEAGAMGVFLWFGLPAPSALAFALLRRLRQVLWILAGLGILAHLTRGAAPAVAE
ncbi:lysylphosphatidylglycerol synthase domain-containing protein [Nitrospira sp. Kam-Ns4a]